MNQEKHYRCLESMYAAAPINAIYKSTLAVAEGEATIEIELSPENLSSKFSTPWLVARFNWSVFSLMVIGMPCNEPTSRPSTSALSALVRLVMRHRRNEW